MEKIYILIPKDYEDISHDLFPFSSTPTQEEIEETTSEEEIILELSVTKKFIKKNGEIVEITL